MTAFETRRQGESLDFVFDRGDETVSGWVCNIEVKQFTDDTSLISREIPQVDREWPGFLTATETDALSPGTYRLIGVLTNAETDEEEQRLVRFKVSEGWAT